MGVSPRQALAIKRSTATVNLWYGSVRSGKTHASIWAWADRVARHRGEGLLLVVGMNRNTVWRNIFQLIYSHDDFAALAPHLRYREGAPSGTLFGKEFQVVGASDESSWLRIQGMTVAVALGDEVTGWPLSFWDMFESRLSLPSSWFLGTCNPGTSAHYLVSRVIDRSDGVMYHVEKMLLRHNPFVAASVKDRYRRIFTGVFARRMLHAEWVAAEGAVFEQWDPEMMTVEPRTLVGPLGGTIEDGQVRLIEALSLGVDYGTQHPTAGELVCLGSDGRIYLTHEWAPNPGNKRLTDKQLADSLVAWLARLDEQGLRPRFIYADPAAASFREELHQRGLMTTRADNDVLNGIATMDAVLTGGDLRISRACRYLIEEAPGYRWDEKAAQRGQDKPIKEKDDAVDAARYAVYSSRHLWRRHVGGRV